MERAPHGQFQLQREGQLLLVDGRGPFNKEIIRAFQRALTDEVMALSGTRWGYVGTLRVFLLLKPKKR